MIKNEMNENETNKNEMNENTVREILLDKNLKNLVDFKDTFTVVSVDEETFTLKDTNDDLYHFWIETAMFADGWLTAVCHDSDAEFEFDCVYFDEDITEIVK